MIQIDEMILRFPGLGSDEGTDLASDVARKLSDRMGEDNRSRIIESLKINVPAGKRDRGNLADAIVEQIISQLKIAAR
jgi:hypothetical protein